MAPSLWQPTGGGNPSSSGLIFFLHLPLAPQGQATDIAIQAEEIMKLKKQLYNIYAKHTKQSLQVIGEHPARAALPWTALS